jgi:hypothetical protein
MVAGSVPKDTYAAFYRQAYKQLHPRGLVVPCTNTTIEDRTVSNRVGHRSPYRMAERLRQIPRKFKNKRSRCKVSSKLSLLASKQRPG